MLGFEDDDDVGRDERETFDLLFVRLVDIGSLNSHSPLKIKRQQRVMLQVGCDQLTMLRLHANVVSEDVKKKFVKTKVPGTLLTFWRRKFGNVLCAIESPTDTGEPQNTMESPVSAILRA